MLRQKGSAYMNIAICDDTLEHVNILEKHLEMMNNHNIECNVFFSGEELVSAYENNNADYDVILLDMEMKRLNGIETANNIREMDERVIIVFVTNYTEYMKESFKCLPFRFLVKPVEFDEIKTVFDDICKKLSKQRKVFAFTENKTKVRLYCDDIIYCESQAHWIWIHTKERIYKLCSSMNDLYEKLDKKMLFRVHQSFIINFSYIKTIKEQNIQLYHSNILIPIGRSYKKTVIKEYTNFVERNLYV